jgi:hypothetical protein
MVRPARKVFKKLKFAKYTYLDSGAWEEVERIIGRKLSVEIRNKVESANVAYAKFGSLHAKPHASKLSDAKLALVKWIKTSRALMLELRGNNSVTAIDRETLIGMFSGETQLRRLRRIQPLDVLDHVLEGAVGFASRTLDEMDSRSLSPELPRDMWFAWAQLVALAMQDAGIKISASSANKNKESPFVGAVVFLSNFLPVECRHYQGYESIAKGAQKARKKFKGCDSTSLYAILGAFGSGILSDYDPESARELSRFLKDQTASRDQSKKI